MVFFLFTLFAWSPLPDGIDTAAVALVAALLLHIFDCLLERWDVALGRWQSARSRRSEDLS